MTIAGHHVDAPIYESESSLVYRGYEKVKGRSVILKMLKQPYPPPEKIAWFRREYELIRSLHLDGVITAYRLVSDDYRPVMLLEDFGGDSLEIHLRQRQHGFTMAEFLPLAIAVADCVGQIHQQHIMHKDVNPSNIVWNQETHQVKLIDFGISTVLTRENPTLRTSTVGEGTLAYMSPEQTGRMNRDMDYRTDLYSLGVTFYELLTGQLPFPSGDALALMHAHIAKQPPPLHELVPAIPQSLAALVMKLMAKNAEDRYQSVLGLKADLEECLRQWQTRERVEIFPLGRHDPMDRFEVSRKLYGRDAEIGMLFAAFERVRRGACEIMLVTGTAGVGKSALVREVYKPITQHGGYVTTGKFEQFHRNAPYASLAQAFQRLVRQLLTEEEAQITKWRERLLNALGPNGQVIVDIIPEVSLLIGPQPPVSLLPPVEAQNRLNLVFQNFLRVFIQEEQPFTLCLDDLQWADSASLSLLQRLLTVPENHYLFVIGTYRENEVHDAHPLRLLLGEIRKAGGIVNHIALSPLEGTTVCQLVAHTLHCTKERVNTLAELIHHKTEGTPFFINEFMKLLHTEDLLTFNPRRGGWQWDVATIEAHSIADNVVELTTKKLRKLSPRTQRIVQIAACLGNQFNLRELAIACGQSTRETTHDLWEAMEDGVILPQDNTYKLMSFEIEGLTDEVTTDYKFAHDRIQQAAYALIPEGAKPAIHWQIGQLLQQYLPQDERERKVFDIVNHLNLGHGLSHHQTDRDELAKLNLIAGTKAKNAAAYGPALNYFASGLTLLGEHAWKRHYDLTLALAVNTAEASYLNGDFERTERLIDTVCQHANTLLDTVKAYEVRLAAYSVQNKQREGVTAGCHLLQLLQHPLPESPTPEDIVREVTETQRALAGKTIEQLLNLPEMSDPYARAAVDVLFHLIHHAYSGAPELSPFIVCRIVTLSARYGNTRHSASGYATYGGLILCGMMGEIETGYQFGQLALRLVDRFQAKESRSSILFIVNGFVRHWKEHIRETLQPLLEAYHVGLETGDLSVGTQAAFDYGFQSYWMGKELTVLEQELAKYSAAFGSLKQEHMLSLNRMYQQVVENLLGKTENPCCLVGHFYNEETMLTHFSTTNNVNALVQAYLHKLILCYLFRQYSQCLGYAALTERYLNGVIGTPAVPAFHWYDSLARLAVIPDIEGPERERHCEKIAANQQKMKHWADHAPMNYLHKFYLVEAERARVLGAERDAREYYDQAIDLAREHGYVNEEALATELAAKFYLARGQTRLAQYYLREAHYAYTCWGATAKVKDLELHYPKFLSSSDLDFSRSITSTVSPNTEQRFSNAFDFTSVLKASQAISREIVLDQLLTSLMKILLENAGAQRGLLLLEKDGHLVIEAEGKIEQDEVTVLQSIPLETSADLPLGIIHYVERTKESVVLREATRETVFANDPYLRKRRPKSVLCVPLVKQGKLTGIVYLENNLTTGAFTADRLAILNVLAAEAVISIENARLYQSLEKARERLTNYSKVLEHEVEERTQELQEKNHELEIANQQVIEANRRKSQFLAGMSHQLRTPMNAILGFTRLVLRRAGDQLPDRQRENLAKVKESAENLLTLINDLLDLSKIEAGGMEVRPAFFAVPAFLHSCCESVAPLVHPGVRLRHEISSEVGEAYTDEDGLRQVLLNLLSNALKFTHTGEVVVRARVMQPGCEDAALVMTVSDTGVGIPPQALSRIFEEFQQVESRGQQEGTGLGLPIAKKWVELLGGTISVESAPGKGSTFTVTLPVIYQPQRPTPTESVGL